MQPRTTATAQWVGAALLAMSFMLSSAPSARATSTPAAGPSAPPVDGPVTAAVSRTGQYLTDDSGRVVIFHGFNIVKKLSPYYPSTITSTDARLLANEGFTIARIGFIWAAAEPRPGVYDDAYIRKIIAFSDMLGRYGIRTLVDFHQDEYAESAGGDGAPPWATVGVAASSGEPAYLNDWQAFWDNTSDAKGVGIQTRFVSLWGHIAPMIAGNTNIMGIDPLNEPAPGSLSGCTPLTFCPTWARSSLYPFYVKVIAAIRASDKTHVIFPEANPIHENPDVGTFNATAIGLPAFADQQTAFNFHSYCLVTEGSGNGRTGTPADAKACAPLDTQSVEGFTQYAASLDVPAIITEFSAHSVSADNERMLDLINTHLLTYTSWEYYYPVGDPADSAGDGLFVNPAGPHTEANANQSKLDDYDTPYPQAVAGTPLSYTYDRTARVMRLTYSTTEASGKLASTDTRTQIFVPQRHYKTGYEAAITGGHVTSSSSAPWLEVVANHGARTVTVTLSPATHGSTLRPLATLAFAGAGSTAKAASLPAGTAAAQRTAAASAARATSTTGDLASTGGDQLLSASACAALVCAAAVSRRHRVKP